MKQHILVIGVIEGSAAGGVIHGHLGQSGQVLGDN